MGALEPRQVRLDKGIRNQEYNTIKKLLVH